MRIITATASICFLVVPTCAERERPSSAKMERVKPEEGYLPSISSTDEHGTDYRFSERQLKRMEETPLDRALFLQYLEVKWPISRLRSYCRPENRWPPGYQNLVPMKPLFGTLEIPVHKEQKHGFNEIYVYVIEDDGNNMVYHGTAGTKWKRWTFSLNVIRGKDHWVIIENLPNDFMDNPAKYLPR